MSFTITWHLKYNKLHFKIYFYVDFITLEEVNETFKIFYHKFYFKFK